MFRLPHVAFALLIAAKTATAGGLTADAFGLYTLPAESDSRAVWAGIRWQLGGRTDIVEPTSTDTVLLFMGPKSLVAGKDAGHAVAILLDAAGNLARDGTPARFRIGGEERAVPSINGIADWLFRPSPIARELLSGVTADGRQSPRTMIRVVSDLESVLPWITRGGTPPVLPEQFFDFRTSALSDRFGNLVEDGAAIGFVARDHSGAYSLATGLVAGGEATVRYLARDISGELGIVATLAGIRTSEFGLRIPEPRAIAPEVRAAPLPEIGALRVVIGPFLTGEGYLLTDGAEVSVTLSDADMPVQKTWARDGYAEVVLPIAPQMESLDIEITSPLGTHRTAIATSRPDGAPVRAVME